MRTLFRVTAVFIFGLYIVPISSADPVVVWGNFNYAPASTNLPASATNIVAITAGDTHCLALRGDGSVVAWGSGGVGQTNVPANLTGVVSIAAGSTHSLALRNDNTLVAWGAIFPSSVKITVPLEATNIAALALGAGAQHALVLRTDGTVLDWGNTIYGSSLTNVPATVRNVVAVAAGATYGLALRSDGSVVTWGTNFNTVPASATNIAAIATGWFGNAALRADGTVLTWGSAVVLPSFSGFTNVVDLVCPFPGVSSDVLALRRNGTLVEYSAGVPTYPTNTITAIAGGSYTAFALPGTGIPIFSGLPVNRTVAIGSRAYFRALAVGAMPMNFQWNCNGTNIPSATNTMLVLTNVQPEQAGNYYSLVASNASGIATNGAMFLNEVPVDFAVQPQTLSVFAGATAKFNTAYTNGVGPFAFQWQFAYTNLPSATNSSLTLANVQLNQAGPYSLIVSNRYGYATNIANLSVTPLMFKTGSTNLVMTTNGLQLHLDSVYATNAVFIFASTDLVSWLPIYTNPPATGSVMFLDVGATNTPQRFYRAMEQ